MVCPQFMSVSDQRVSLIGNKVDGLAVGSRFC